MRTIKFRGFTTDLKYNVWNYGFLVGNRICEKVLEKSGLKLSNNVDPKSIGQFTGLYDIEGKEIYEGDIVEFGKEDTKYYNLPNVPHVLIYSEKFAGFFIRRLDMDKEERDYLRYVSSNIVKRYKIKVIGNIYESTK